MRTTVLLVSFRDGWLERVHSFAASWRRVEGFLDVGDVNKYAARRVADKELARLAGGVLGFTVEVEPVSTADMPYLAYEVGDSPMLSGEPERVVELSVQEAEDGELSFGVRLRERELTPEERIDQAQKRMINGTLRGESRTAAVRQETRPQHTMSRAEIMKISQVSADAVAVGESGDDPVPISGTVTSFKARLTTAGTTSTFVDLKVNGVVVGTVELPPGVIEAEVYPNVDVRWGADYVRIAVTAAGAGAAKLVTETRIV